MRAHSIVTGASAYSHGAPGSEAMVLNNVQCRGSEATLLDCPEGLPTSCPINVVAGVVCSSRTG